MLTNIFNKSFENVEIHKKYVAHICSNRDSRDTSNRFIINIIFLISSILFFIKSNTRIKNFSYKFSTSENK